MKLHLFNISNFKVDGGAMFGVVPKVLWSHYYPADEDNNIVLALRSLVVETSDHVILIDTGWGDKQDEKFFSHVYLHGGVGLVNGLNQMGFKTEDITDVFLTHLHADHCGGGVKRAKTGDVYEMTFPNAVYHVSRTQWDWAVRNNIREEDSFLRENIIPMGEAGNLNLVETEGDLFPGFSVMICYGHTPGMMIPLIRYKGKTIVFAGDLVPTSAHIPLIWNMSYDIETLKTIDEKQRLLNEAFENEYILLFQHDENVECCSLTKTPRGIRSKKEFTLSEIL